MNAPISRLLVANRGEIARRVIRTCRTLGISPVAVHSDVDASAPHVREADAAVRLPGLAAAETYLRADLLVAAARRTGADAVHPGYGFLAEDAGFARAVLAAGLVWVGPPPEAIATMGSKVDAKRRVADAGVPVLPTWAPDSVPADAPYPLLVKASYGGGGRGMRIVADRSALDEAVAAARREAESAFGDGTVFVEPYVRRPRHVEVQVLADQHGAVLALGERECSIQRRHQKIVEEAPAPGLPPALRDRLAAAAVAAARAVGYRGAGTVEFLVTPDGGPAFLEMNTRLQVEHPVTEAVLGLDLVALQISVAEGRPLPFAGSPPVRGHAIEVRLYAEDPAAGWRPSTGAVHRLAVPGVDVTFAAGRADRGLRLDAGVVDGDEVSPHYDPMLAKLVAWAPTREEATRRLADALARATLHGVTTTRDLLVRVLRHPAFGAAETDTGFLDRHPEVLAPLAGPEQVREAALATALASSARRRAAAPVLRTLPAGWRNNPSQPATAAYDGPDGTVEVTYRPASRTVVSATPDRVVLERDTVRSTYEVHAVGTVSFVDGPGWSVVLSEVDPLPEPAQALPTGSLTAPMPGLVLAVRVAKGDRVAAGQPLLTLEAMKMEHPVRAPAEGTVTELRVTAGSQVDAGDVLAVVEPVAGAEEG
jgi:propionyl-CoA carboxylase alpha chain